MPEHLIDKVNEGLYPAHRDTLQYLLEKGSKIWQAKKGDAGEILRRGAEMAGRRDDARGVVKDMRHTCLDILRESKRNLEREIEASRIGCRSADSAIGGGRPLRW